MKKPRRGEAFGFLVEVRGFAARCARSFRCGGCAALRAARQTLARLLRSAPRTGFEPRAPSLDMKKPRRSEAFKNVGGGKGVRTPGLRLAKPALSQLSYTPFRNKHPSGDSALAGVSIAKEKVVDLTRFELVTSRLSAGRSNQLSYRSIALEDNTPVHWPKSTTFFRLFESP